MLWVDAVCAHIATAVLRSRAWSLARWLDSGLDSLAVLYAADEGDRDQVTKALMDEPVKGCFGDAAPDQGEVGRSWFRS